MKIVYICALVLTLLTLVKAQSQKQQFDKFLKEAGITRKQLSLQAARNGKLAYSNFDNYRELLLNFKSLQIQSYERNKEYITNLHRRQGRLQPLVEANQKFPCDLNNSRSEEVPTSVNRLRPGDIDIVAAMGDSLTAGTGAMGHGLSQGFAEFRGVTFLGGGLEDWRTYLTIPNILKEYNPQLYGYAIGNTLARERPSRFNVAEPFAETQDMPFQALVLIKRLQHDPKVNMTQHWKMINLLIGSNDICSSMCYYDNWNEFLENHRKDMYKTLMTLKSNIPRVLVNLLPAVNVQDVLPNMQNTPPICSLIHPMVCSCIVSSRWNSLQLKRIHKFIKRMQKIDEELAALPEFQTEDFSVAYRGFSGNLKLEKYPNGDSDLRYFADDCFHLSQLGNAAAAQTLWNSMIQGVPQERKEFQPFSKLECPSADRPFISTLKNDVQNN